MEDFRQSVLGSTGLNVGRLGMAASYGAPADALEEAFENGCNYFYWGSHYRRGGMSMAIKNICARGQRDKLVVAIHTYARVWTARKERPGEGKMPPMGRKSTLSKLL